MKCLGDEEKEEKSKARRRRSMKTMALNMKYMATKMREKANEEEM